MFDWKHKRLEDSRHEREKYQFMKEEMRPNRRRYLSRLGKRIIQIGLSAVFFGVVAALVFGFVRSRVQIVPEVSEGNGSQFTSKSRGATLRREIISYAQNGDLTLDDYDIISKQLAAIGHSYEGALVSIYWREEYSKAYSLQEESNPVSGLLFKESKNKYYIVAMTEDKHNEQEVSVRFVDGPLVEAEFFASDEDLGMLILTVDKQKVFKEVKSQLEVVELDSSADGLVSGSTVIFAGSPTGKWGSVMHGNIIQIDEKVNIEDNCIALYMTDVGWREGANGIVLDARGKLVGMIACSKLTAESDYGISFVATSKIKQDITFLVEGNKIARFGVKGRSLSEKSIKKHELDSGIFVTTVSAGSPAYLGGMRVADVIVQVGDENPSSMEELHQLLLRYKAGDEIAVRIARNVGEKLTYRDLKIVLE